ncbi:MAG: DUF3050 domain-containing protein [Bdellovibrionales bacterium]|nr:DUF3050 domain-containing protein [Bdellovibrionales bacterium]
MDALTTINHPDILAHHEHLKNHSLYKSIQSISHLKTFMETHVFAVWDFMTLLKRLQREITCVDLPWNPSAYPKGVVRLINEIVLGEESDLDLNGQACDHFTLYIRAMKDIEADSSRLLSFTSDLNFEKWCSPAERDFVSFNLELAKNGKIHEVAAAFFFGREKLIPDMFTSILGDLGKNFNQKDQESFPNLKYYLERHIEIDGGQHSHAALDCLNALCGEDVTKWEQARLSGVKSLTLRSALWDEVEKKVTKKA